MPYAHLLKDYRYRVESPREPIPLACVGWERNSSDRDRPLN